MKHAMTMFRATRHVGDHGSSSIILPFDCVYRSHRGSTKSRTAWKFSSLPKVLHSPSRKVYRRCIHSSLLANNPFLGKNPILIRAVQSYIYDRKATITFHSVPMPYVHFASFQSPLKTTLPAINHKIRTIDIATCPTTQQYHNARQLLRHTHPPHWIPRGPRIPSLRYTVSLIEYSVHVPRRNSINAYTVNSPFGCQR